MSKKQGRREFIKLLTLAGFSLYLPGCGGEEEAQSNDQPLGDQAPKDTTPKPPPPPPKDEVEAIEDAYNSNNVVYVRQDDEDYDEKRTCFNLRTLKKPKLIALPKNTEGVSEAIRLAHQEDLKVAIKSGGHSFEGFSSIDGGMQINLSFMNEVTWKENDQVVIGPSLRLRELYDEIIPKGRILPAGSCGTVGVAGLALGGGYGFFARKHGLTCDNMVRATLVDGLGKIHEVKDGDELMWALKGGGNSNFGVVTEMEFKTHKAPKMFTRYRFKAKNLDKPRAKELLQKYFEYSSKLPDTAFAAFVLNYKTLVLLITNFGEEDQGLKDMVEAFEPICDTAEIGTKKELGRALKTYYGVQEPLYFRNASAGYYDNYETISGCIDQVMDIVFRKRGLIYQINTLGGNIDNPEFEANSCYPHRAVPYLSELQYYYEEGRQSQQLMDSFDEIQQIIYDAGIRRQYRNYPNLGWDHWETAYFGDNYGRLQSVKEQYDPKNIFTHEQTVKTAVG